MKCNSLVEPNSTALNQRLHRKPTNFTIQPKVNHMEHFFMRQSEKKGSEKPMCFFTLEM